MKFSLFCTDEKPGICSRSRGQNRSLVLFVIFTKCLWTLDRFKINYNNCSPFGIQSVHLENATCLQLQVFNRYSTLDDDGRTEGLKQR